MGQQERIRRNLPERGGGLEKIPGGESAGKIPAAASRFFSAICSLIFLIFSASALESPEAAELEELGGEASEAPPGELLGGDSSEPVCPPGASTLSASGDPNSEVLLPAAGLSLPPENASLVDSTQY
uniref:Uncharacterized protein n=1 Tax=Chromera velia CCMP2878 TaxID=1169474 RepID=A0A0G4GHA4_9ALVE|eukprot:Cvel_21848.t1-p1 / transcript=Cvel_21848.t1 / gene=Cvel_21848 / organism=Chromera_velia_CCMP2878 / gene_product=hypothetical protein / transcript_product=hypothetical protein / location=Cvel_scaffold2087:26276-26653(-) / protein_length=126 / sequence_SO=supercontig / SO=protein_coding / is_pseudo=false